MSIWRLSMKKIILLAALSSISFTCYANGLAIALNMSGCSSFTSGNLTGCFQNNTDANLTNYHLKQTLIFENGTSEENISNLGALQPNFFSVISTSTTELNKEKISSAWFAVITGDATLYNTIPGCTIEFTPSGISRSIVGIYKVGESIYCK